MLFFYSVSLGFHLAMETIHFLGLYLNLGPQLKKIPVD